MLSSLLHRMALLLCLGVVAVVILLPCTVAFSTTSSSPPMGGSSCFLPTSRSSLFLSSPDGYLPHKIQYRRVSALSSTPDNTNDDINRDMKFNREIVETTTNLDDANNINKKEVIEGTAAATNTVNERLLAELKVAESKERFGARSAAGKKLGMVDGYGRPRKSEEEIQAAIAAARDLNGVNPVVCLTGGVFALIAAGGLWYGTQELGTFFALHPVETEVYFVVRASQVVRNVAMGLISLASGFFFVTGLGIFGLGVRVTYGVAMGELDPTPIKQNQKVMAGTAMPNVWELMMGKKPNNRRSRGGGSGGNDNNPFGI